MMRFIGNPITTPAAGNTPVAQIPGNTLNAELVVNQQKAAATLGGESLSEEQKTVQLNKLSKPVKVGVVSAGQLIQPTAKTAPAASPTNVSTDKRN